jgi:hypothetical protein
MVLLIIFFVIFSTNTLSQIYWVKLGKGINYGVTNNQSGNDIAIIIGGWQAKQEWVNKWSEELFKAKLKDLGVQHLISVKGPDEVCFKSKDIDIKTLAEFVKNIIYATYFIDKVIIIAHSSGSFVAHDLLNMMYGTNGIAKDSFYVNKTYYFNLDGGIGGSDCGIAIDTSVINHINKVYAVAVYDSASNLYSANYETMKKLGELYVSKSELILIESKGSDCKSKWCLHDVLIINKPHNPEKYDLEKDYQMFEDKRNVVTKYLEVLSKSEVDTGIKNSQSQP